MKKLNENIELMKEWDFDKNILDPKKLTQGSGKYAFWKCKVCGYFWSAKIQSRANGHGCPKCQKIVRSRNQAKTNLKKSGSFKEHYPELLKEWDFEKNIIDPNTITPKSNIKAHWKCKCGYRWITTIKTRANGHGCPKCGYLESGKQIANKWLRKSGSLSEYCKKHFPDLIKEEWDFEKNTLDPDKITPKSNIKAHWRCKFGHKYQALIGSRTNGHGCSKCSNQTSKLEIFVYTECLKLFTNVKWREKINGYECDVYLEDEKIAIEIDGGLWHKDKLDKDIKKSEFLKSMSINLIRIRHETLVPTQDNLVTFKYTDKPINIFIKVLAFINKDFSEYIANKLQLGKEEYNKIITALPAPIESKNLVTKFPEIAKEWDNEKNYPYKPEMFSFGSGRKVNWICSKCGYNWEAKIAKRTNGNNCPNCFKVNRGNLNAKSKLAKKGSFVIKFPKLQEEWDFEKNFPNKPEEFSAGSNKKAYWICNKCGHSWLAKIQSRTNGRGCFKCSEFNRSERTKQAHARKKLKSQNLSKTIDKSI